MKRHIHANRQPISPVKRGAALIYALVAVLVIAVLALGVGRLVAHHAYSEDTAQGYARAIYIAEAAANAQLARMSRSNLPGAPNNVPGRLPWEAVNTWNETTGQYEPINPLSAAELGVNVEGAATVWVKSAAQGGLWTAPEDFVLFAYGTDPVTGIQRGVAYNGTGTGLGDPYALFGQNELRFESMPLGPNSNGVCTLKTGYIGSNGRVSFNTQGTPPVAQTPPSGYFFGCRLGPNALLQPGAGNWTNGWDIPRLPDIVRWPTINQVIAHCWRGLTPAQAATQNDNVQIQYRNTDGSFSNFTTLPTQLTNTEFNQSQHNPKTIRIRARLNAPNHNLIYLTNIQMRPLDVLILDLRKEDGSNSATGIRILINNPGLVPGQAPTITNLAYFETENPLQVGGDQKAQYPAYIWFNNTNQPLTYRPYLAAQELAPPPDEDNDSNVSNYRYRLRSSLRGLAYGITSLPNSAAGDVIIEGNPLFSAGGATIQSVVGNHVLVRGKVTVHNAESVESPKDLNRYVLYYRIKSRGYGEIKTGFTPMDTGAPIPREPVYSFGPF